MGKTGTMAVEVLFPNSRFVSPNAVLTTKKASWRPCLQEVYFLFVFDLLLHKRCSIAILGNEPIPSYRQTFN